MNAISRLVRYCSRLFLVSAVLFIPSVGSAATTYFYWTFDGTPPSTSNDLHFVFDIVDPPPFAFGEPVSTDDGPYSTFSSSTPDIGTGGFTVDYSGATPSTDPVHVEFNFTADSNVVLVSANWTLQGNNIGPIQPGDLTVEQVETPEPATLVLSATGILLGGWFTWRRRTRLC